jgi:hypothetical protein
MSIYGPGDLLADYDRLDTPKGPPMRKLIVSLCDHSGGWTRPYVEAGYLVLRIDPKHADRTGAGRGVAEDDDNFGRYGVQTDDGGWNVGITAGEFARCVEMMGLEATVYDLTGICGVTECVGVIAQPPCTDFAGSGARHFAAKDADGRTQTSVGIVRQCLDVVRLVKPRWWVLENPVGRIARLVPDLGRFRCTFNPCDFAGHAPDPAKDAYTKRTCLWGDFNAGLPTAPVDPVMVTKATKDGRTLRGSWMWATLGGKSERTKELRSVTPAGFARAFFLANA